MSWSPFLAALLSTVVGPIEEVFHILIIHRLPGYLPSITEETSTYGLYANGSETLISKFTNQDLVIGTLYHVLKCFIVSFAILPGDGGLMPLQCFIRDHLAVDLQIRYLPVLFCEPDPKNTHSR